MDLAFLIFMVGVIFIVAGYSFQVRPLCKDTKEIRYVSIDEYSDLIINDDKDLINNSDIFDGCERSLPEPTEEGLILLSEADLIRRAKSIKDIKYLKNDIINNTLQKIEDLQYISGFEKIDKNKVDFNDYRGDLIKLIIETQRFAKDKLLRLDYNKLKEKALYIKGITEEELLDYTWNENTQQYSTPQDFEDYKNKWVNLIIKHIIRARCKPRY